MARIIRPLRKSLLLSSSSKTLIKPIPTPISISDSLSRTSIATRNYISVMRKSAFEGNILRLLRNEIQYELDRSPPTQPVTKFDSFTIEDRPGEQWVRLKRKFGGNEDIKIEATMFDGSLSVPKSAGVDPGKDTELHITLIVNISKEEGANVLEILCSAWPDSIEIKKLFIRGHEKMPAQPYVGPEFKELDDDLQDSLYEFLEARGITDEIAVFLHRYMKNKDKTEFINWMGTIKSFIEKVEKYA